MMIPHISEYGNERSSGGCADAAEQIYLLTLNNNATYTNTCCVCSIERRHVRTHTGIRPKNFKKCILAPIGHPGHIRRLWMAIKQCTIVVLGLPLPADQVSSKSESVNFQPHFNEP